MTASRILITESSEFSLVALERLSGHEVRREDLALRSDLLAGIGDAEVLWVRLRHRIDEEVFSAAPALRYVVTPTTGLNHIDLEAAESRGIHVLSLKGEEAFLRDVRATAELTIGLMLSLLRRLPGAIRHVVDGGWNRDLFRGGELMGCPVGIVGYGRLGRIVGRYLLAFGAEVVATDPHVSTGEFDAGIEPVPLDRLLAGSRVVTLHVNLDEATRGFFGAGEIGALRGGALLVNTSRGELVDEAALLAALETGAIAGAALDVLAGEHPAVARDHPLVRHAAANDNLLITPHLGGATAESMHKTEIHMADLLIGALP